MSLEILKKGLDEQGIVIGERRILQFEKFARLLDERNQVMNLTAVKSGRDTEIRHFLDSLSPLFYRDGNTLFAKDGVKVADLGTGAGFPGIPLAIMLPHAEFVLCDALQKRISFLNDVVRELGLANVRTVCGRLEELGRDPGLREGFDIAVSRAVADLKVLVELSLPFVKEGGVFISYKGDRAAEEVTGAENALRELNGKVVHIFSYDEYDSSASRNLVEIMKDGITPDRYPRRNGIPTKRPL